MDLDSDDLNSSSDSDTEANPGVPELQTQSSSTSNDLQEKTPLATNSKSKPSDNVSPPSPHAISNKAETGKDNSDISVMNTESGIKHQQGVDSTEPIALSDDHRNKKEACDNEPIDLDQFNSCDELAELGMERLKNALMSRGLKCGGTCQERAERLFSVKGLTPDQIDPSLMAKSKGKGKRTK